MALPGIGHLGSPWGRAAGAAGLGALVAPVIFGATALACGAPSHGGRGGDVQASYNTRAERAQQQHSPRDDRGAGDDHAKGHGPGDRDSGHGQMSAHDHDNDSDDVGGGGGGAPSCTGGSYGMVQNVMTYINGNRVGGLGSAGSIPGSIVKVVFSVPAGCSAAVTLASYYAPENFWNSADLPQYTYQTQSATVGGGSTGVLSVAVPSCNYQVDFAYGPTIATITSTANDYAGRLIGANNGPANDVTCAAFGGGGGGATPTPTTPPSPTTVPTATPTGLPTALPTGLPSPTTLPTGVPTATPTASGLPTGTVVGGGGGGASSTPSPSSGALGVSTTGGGAGGSTTGTGPGSGVLAVSTPSTGADLPLAIAALLVLGGLATTLTGRRIRIRGR